jgi:hypothetical protein
MQPEFDSRDATRLPSVLSAIIALLLAVLNVITTCWELAIRASKGVAVATIVTLLSCIALPIQSVATSTG